MASLLHLHVRCIPSCSQSGLDGDRDLRYPSCGTEVQTHPPSAELPVLLKTAVCSPLATCVSSSRRVGLLGVCMAALRPAVRP